MNSIAKFLAMGLVCVLVSTGLAFGSQSSLLRDRQVELSGTLEAQAVFRDTDVAGEDDTSDIILATAELGIDAKANKHVSGRITFLYEDAVDDAGVTDLEIDEGYIRLDGENKSPFYAEAGQLYLPFGNYETHFISDPLTLQLGETREVALVLGYGHPIFEISIGMFNGDVNETGETDDMIDGFCASAVFTRAAERGLSFSAGVSFLSNLGDSDGLTGQLSSPNEVVDYVPAVAAFVHIGWNNKLFLKVEHVAAMDEFTGTDIDFAASDVEPWALNVEAAYALTDRLEIGVRFGATDEAGTFLPEYIHGVVASYALFENTEIALEFQHGEYENDDDFTTAILQLALEF